MVSNYEGFRICYKSKFEARKKAKKKILVVVFLVALGMVKWSQKRRRWRRMKDESEKETEGKVVTRD